MMNNTRPHIAAVILAGGRGKRMNFSEGNKVTVSLAEKPIILHIVQFMQKLFISTVVVVVGHAKESVIHVLEGEEVLFAEQKEQLGTGHALASALAVLPQHIRDTFVVYGDDAVFYNTKHLPVMEQLFDKHLSQGSVVTFLTIEQDDPTGLGRIVRNSNGQVQSIMEEKDATEEQKKIHEINPGCFVFSVDFLKEYLSKVEKSPVTGEYYLTSLVDLAIKHGKKVETVRGGKLSWRGVNTPEELALAEALLKKATL